MTASFSELAQFLRAPLLSMTRIPRAAGGVAVTEPVEFITPEFRQPVHAGCLHPGAGQAGGVATRDVSGAVGRRRRRCGCYARSCATWWITSTVAGSAGPVRMRPRATCSGSKICIGSSRKLSRGLMACGCLARAPRSSPAAGEGCRSAPGGSSRSWPLGPRRRQCCCMS